MPARGTAGCDERSHFRPYNLPGEYIDDANGGNIVGEKFFGPTPTTNQPVQTSDWWNGAGLQYQGWVAGNDAGNVVARTRAMISEPFETQFVDLPAATAGARTGRAGERRAHVESVRSGRLHRIHRSGGCPEHALRARRLSRVRSPRW